MEMAATTARSEGLPREAALVRAALVRPLGARGETWLARGDDGRCYWSRGATAEAGCRPLVNEWLAALLARAAGLPVPEPMLLWGADASAGEAFGQAAASGWSCGLQLPAEPTETAIWEHLPAAILPKTTNLQAGLGAWLLGAWTGRSRAARAWFTVDPEQGGGRYRLTLFDHGDCFGGERWQWREAAPALTPWQRRALEQERSWEVVEASLERFLRLSSADLEAAAGRIPSQWLAADSDRFALEELLRELRRRLERLGSLAETSLRAEARRRN